MNRLSNMWFQIRQWFWIGLYSNCWWIIGGISRISDFAASHIQTKPRREDAYMGVDNSRYPWKNR